MPEGASSVVSDLIRGTLRLSEGAGLDSGREGASSAGEAEERGLISFFF